MKRFTRALVGGRFEAIGSFVEGEVKKSLAIGQDIEWRTSKKGNRYPVGKNPSTPPDPPHTLTGRLKQSISHDVIRKPREIVARVGTNVEYAHRLEMGFVDKDKAGRNVSQAPRPYLRKAIWDNKAKILRMLSGRK